MKKLKVVWFLWADKKGIESENEKAQYLNRA